MTLPPEGEVDHKGDIDGQSLKIDPSEGDEEDEYTDSFLEVDNPGKARDNLGRLRSKEDSEESVKEGDPRKTLQKDIPENDVEELPESNCKSNLGFVFIGIVIIIAFYYGLFLIISYTRDSRLEDAMTGKYEYFGRYKAFLET